MPGKRPQLNFDVEPAIKRQFKSAVEARGESVREVLMRAVTEYLKNEAGAAQSTLDSETKPTAHDVSHWWMDTGPDRRWHWRLAYILRSNVDSAYDAITHNLNAFVYLCQHARGESFDIDDPGQYPSDVQKERDRTISEAGTPAKPRSDRKLNDRRKPGAA
jgi:hypothetical protein